VADVSSPGGAPRSSTARTWWPPSTRQIVGGVIAIVALLFVFQNRATAHFNFLWLDFKAPRWIWLLVVFGAGVVTGLLFARHRARSSTAKT
jgi:uncharacterized integral membrane protein